MEESAHVPFRTKALHEIRTIFFVTLYFAACFLILMLMKMMVLAQYGVEFRGVSLALVGALVAAKVVLILEKVPLGGWVRRQPVIVDTVLRTLLYSLGVAVILFLEKSFDKRHDYSDFRAAMNAVFQSRDIHHVLATTIGVGGALLGFNVMAVLGLHLGKGGLRRLFFTTTRAELNPRSGEHAPHHKN